MLAEALGEARVLEGAVGIGDALAMASRPAASDAVDYYLLLHDDVALAPDAVERLVEAAEAVESVGVVGAKLVDWENPRILRDIGWAADRFGHLYSPLEPGEIDQGQYDRIREVLFVSDAAMLIAQPAIARVGLLDERLGSNDEELDFCWRVRLAGFRVLMSPLALARHRDAAKLGERKGDRSGEHRRYYEERAAVVAISKNYGLRSVWVLPLYVLQALVKLIALLLARRFEESGDLMAAWTWGFTHFPGTVLRRVKAQAVRAVKDREIHRYMAHGSVRLRRWLDAAGRFLPGDVDLPGEDDEGTPSMAPLRERATSVARSHPVATAWATGAVVAAFAYRHLIGPGQLTGGGLPAVLPSATGYFAELFSGVRTTVFGGAQAASPALGAMGAAAAVPLSSAALAETILILVLPVFAGMSMYRAALRASAHRVGSLVAAGCYVLSPVMLWSFSTGRIPLLVLLAVIPKLADRLETAYGPVPPARRWRFLVGTGVFAAVGLAFYPGVALALALLFVVFFLIPERSGRRIGGLGLSLGFAVLGMLLVFPSVASIVSSRGIGMNSLIGVPDIQAMMRLVLAPGKGDWAAGWFLPVSALLCLGLAGPPRRWTAVRFMLAAFAGVGLAWASAAGWLPEAVSNPAAYLCVAAVSYCSLVSVGLAGLFAERRPFSIHQIVSALVVVTLLLGLGLQGLLAIWGSWDVGKRRLPPAWPLVATGEPGDFRILWIGGDHGLPFPAPGGDPTGRFEAGANSFQYSVTDKTGISNLDLGRGEGGDVYGYLDQALAELLSGESRHAGAILGPLGIRFVVAADGQVPASLTAALQSQVDMNLVPAGGLVIYRNDAAVPPFATVPTEGASALTGDAQDPDAVVGLPPISPVEAGVEVKGGWDGRAGEGAVWVGDSYAPGWRLMAGTSLSVPPSMALGWGMTFQPPDPAGPVEIRYIDQWIRTTEMIALALLWLVAVWVTRKPARR
jgi:GT2 family glycosyltransferase